MHALDIYKWLGVSGNKFKKQFQDNEALYKHAKEFWSNLDSNSIIIIGIFVVIGILLAIYYYRTYNNQPGRHYRPKKWLLWLGITAALSLIFSLIILPIIASPKLPGSFPIELKIAFGNALYAVFVYFVVSVVWCNCFPTNAYRMFKFKK